MAFVPRNEIRKEEKAVTFIIHKGSKNLKVKGYLSVQEDKELGQRWLVGEEITGTYQLRGDVMEAKKKVRIEITGLAVTFKG